MLFRPVALWRIDEAATEMLASADETDRADERKAKNILW
jgi:hypothetical protein